MTEDRLEAGRAAHARADWRSAADLLLASEPLGAEDLMCLAEASFWIGQRDLATDARERAYAGFIELHDSPGAARAANALVFDAVQRNDQAGATGWYGRVHRLLAEEPECAEHGRLALMDALVFLVLGRDPEAALSHARNAADLARRYGDRDVEAGGLHMQGNALVRQGHVKEGIALVDEAMASAIGGELSPFTTAQIYCGTISICLALQDYRRAAEWTASVTRCSGRPGMSDFHGDCRLHRCEVLSLRGAWDDATREAELAAEEAEQYSLDHVGLARYTLGQIRLRQGDLDGAETAFERAREFGWDPQPGAALLLMAQGKGDVAAMCLSEAIHQGSWDPLLRAKLRPAQVEVALACRDIATAREAATDLSDIADTFDTEAIRAAASVAEGEVSLAEGRPEDAVKSLREGIATWREAGSPYDAECGRLVLAQALRCAGANEAAHREADQARIALERIGARRDARRASQLASELGPRSSPSRVVRTLMFTDIVDSTPLLEALGDAAWDGLVQWHDETLRSLFAGYLGREVKQQGDGFFVAFFEPASAIECARAIQQKLSEHGPYSSALRVRIGLHATEATEVGDDFRGLGVNIASRIADLAGAGEIVASLQTIEACGHTIDGEPLTVQVKGVKDPILIARIGWKT